MQIIIDNLNDIGIEAEAESIPSDDYFGQLAEGACVFCRVGWLADYPTYDNFTFDIFGSEALDGNNYGYISEEFDELLAEAKATTDADEAGELFRQAEQVLLNDDTGVVPINWYNGQQVYNGDKIANLLEEPTGHVVWRPSPSTADRPSITLGWVGGAQRTSGPPAARSQRTTMTSYIIRRLLQIVPTVFIALSFLFFVFFLLPGDPANLIAGGAERNVDPGVLERVEARYGLGDPILEQFTNYWQRTLQWTWASRS